jgi:hypothetical protein
MSYGSSPDFCKWQANGVLIFKLEEEENFLLLLLPALFAETAVFDSTSRRRCWLVVGIAQAVLFQALGSTYLSGTSPI